MVLTYFSLNISVSCSTGPRLNIKTAFLRYGSFKDKTVRRHIYIETVPRGSDHISAMCCRAARQVNALARIYKYLDPKSKYIIYNSFVASNFNYCPIVWHFCGQVNNNKLEKLQERSLRIIHNDYESSFETLLKFSKQESLLAKRLKIMILEVFKTFNRLNPSCLHDLFTKSEVVYDLRTQKLEQPKRRTTTYGLRTFSY